MNSDKLLTRRQAVQIAIDAREAGKTVVFTNGCFDILHVGHVRYLRQARAMGEMLIVGLNTDESVRALKGPSRPVYSQDDRAEVLAALEFVDYVVMFDESVPVELIKEIRPDIDVKGGDYNIEDMPEAKIMRDLGGRVEIIPYSVTQSEAFSTTQTIRRANNH
ncbi:MAG: D-glycero-beta-D-manno-heptose 1-phosphate adenylyltransferase [Armatimonadetes bacterium]|nr:D-glycero-beta-D-manno-heptose 1-phosphate adenylyltransferase [Armatimonadota bacterium]